MPEPAAGRLIVASKTFNGATKRCIETDVEVAPGQARRCAGLTGFGPISLRKEFLEADLGDSHATMLLIGERFLHLPDAELSARCADGKIEITAGAFARQVRLEMTGAVGAVFEDNFFDLAPGRTRAIRIVDPAGGDEVAVGALNAPAVRLRP